MPSPSTRRPRAARRRQQGHLYRIESPTLYTSLLTMPATQITAFQAGHDGHLYAATGNVGKVYEIGPGLEQQGTIESDVFDAAMYSLWGRLSFEATLNGGQIAIETRSGNLDQPQKNWSPWSAPITTTKGGRITSPAARFVQWRATLTAAASGHSPELESVDVAYLPKNVEPRVDEIEITPPNYRFPPSMTPLISPSQNLSLPPLGRRGTPPSPVLQLRHHLDPVDAVRQGLPRRALAGLRPQRRFAGLHRGDPRRERDRVEAAQGQGGGEVLLLGFHGVSRRRIPPARHCLRRARQSARRGARLRMPRATRSSSTTRRPRSRTSRPRATAASSRCSGTPPTR